MWDWEDYGDSVDYFDYDVILVWNTITTVI